MAIEIARPEIKKTISYGSTVDSVRYETLLALTYQVDSLNQEVRLLQDQHEKALDDLRQETNNIINKLNGWLSFWIAVSAIICVILPIICQYFIIHNFEKEYKKDLDNYKSEIENTNNLFQNDVLTVKNEFSKEKDNVIRNFEEKLCGPEIQSLLAQYRIGNECNLLNGGTSTFNALQWHNAINSLQVSVERFLAGQDSALSITDRYELQKILIQASGFVQEAKRHITRRRERGRVETEIHTLFEQLETGHYENKETIQDLFSDLFKEMRSLI